MILRKPIDHVLSVTNIYKRIRGIASFEAARLRLFFSIFVRTQVPARWGLRLRLFTRHRRPLETIRPQRFSCEIDRRELPFGLVFSRSLRCFDGRGQEAMGVVVSSDSHTHGETNDANKY